MPQLLKRKKVTSVKSPAYGKTYVKPVYPKKFIGTKELADFIQTQATVKRSDCIAVLDELGGAMKHYLEMGQKIKLDNIGTFKVGISSTGSATEEACTAQNVKTKRVLFSPEVVSTPKETRVNAVTGKSYKVFSHQAVMLKDVEFEFAPDNGIDAEEPEQQQGNGD